jgi:uncharacterized protein (TIGR02246 family)
MQPCTSLLTAFTLTTALAFGVAAQQTSNQDTWQAGESVGQALHKAAQARDAAGAAALYSEDAILLTPDGPFIGRAAIEKHYAGSFKLLITGETPKLDQVIMIGDALRLRTGS